MNEVLPDAGEINLLLTVAANKLARSSDPEPFLNWIAESGPHLAPSLAAIIDPRTGPVENAFRAMGVSIYSQTPLPDHNYKCIRLPKPGRNDPCLCGSGRKYKHCCAVLEGVDLMDEYNMLRHVLDGVSKKELATLADTHVDLEAVADTAHQWAQEGKAERAVALLEPWFQTGRKLTRKHGWMFDELMDLYLYLGKPKKRQALLAQVLTADDPVLRCEALQRQATMLMDAGQLREAWDSFQQAQRLDPENPSLAMLEITMLTNSGREREAKERAKFWLARFKRSKDVAPEMLQMLESCAVDPRATFVQASLDMNEDVGELLALLNSAPTIAAHYQIEWHEPGGMLVPDKKLARLEQKWRKTFKQIKPSMIYTQHGDPRAWDNSDAWLEMLHNNSLLWHSFDVLDDLVLAVDALQLGQLNEVLLEPLLQRAQQLVDLNVGAFGDEQHPLPWLMRENRPTLRLLAYKIHHDMHGTETPSREWLQLVERLLQLNPNDNHGVRDLLSHAYLVHGEAQKALALTENYADDVTFATRMNRILALYLTGQQGKALSKLADHATKLEVAVKMLLADNPRQPKLTQGGVTVGGRDEAWYYRIDHLHLWERDGALQWLRQAWKSIKKH